MDTSGNEYFKGAIETLLFVSDKPVTVEQIKEALQTAGVVEIRNLIAELQKDYESPKRGMIILEIAGGYQMLSNAQYVNFVRNFFKTRVKEKLSRPALEALAIVAYKQPVSRMDIEMIRGVNSDGVVAHLLNKMLIKIVGRKDVPGKPYLYGTTKLFLEYFGLKTLRDLPKLEDFPALLPPEQELADAPVEVQQAGLEDVMNKESSVIAATAVDNSLAEPPAASINRVEDVIAKTGEGEGEAASIPAGNLKEAMEQVNQEQEIKEDDQVQSYARSVDMAEYEQKILSDQDGEGSPDADSNKSG